MNTKKSNIKNICNTDSWNGAATKGALVWGSVYSTASTGAAFLLAPVVTGSTPAFSDIFMHSLIIFPTAGAARGLVMWRMKKEKKNAEENIFLSGSKKHKHPWLARSKKAA
ncbi:hypothetical protein [Pontiella sulfatireligans]|uniref:Uncharacterized protein n=1 Tax=Pontiella sulfatireligans TaxID=2750658 RepID=A0A6C2ULC6_9BACT|nr:hypothetical protein [Pontiella sulfatireligans]VGO21040.1 hypothetical protein SCARR_03109 [Pontiella sulfatireligans]